jgi:predicted TPR repeat methyltransferase
LFLKQGLGLDSFATFVSVGNFLKKKNRVDEAVQAYEVALKVNPSDPIVHDSLGSIYVNR